MKQSQHSTLLSFTCVLYLPCTHQMKETCISLFCFLSNSRDFPALLSLTSLICHQGILCNFSYVFFTFLKFYSFILRESRREGEGEGEKHKCVRDTRIGCLLHAPYWGPGLKPRHVPWLGIELVTFRFTGWHSVHWATPARAFWLLLW